MEKAVDSALADRAEVVIVALAGEGALALFELDAAGGLALVDKLRVPGAEGSCRGVPMVASADGTRIYLAWRGEAFRLFSFAFDRIARRLTCLADASLPASMCHVSLSSCGRWVLTSSNTGCTIAVSPVADSGRAGDPIVVQEAHKAHCVVQAPNGWVYATSLRGDFVQSYGFDAVTGALTPRFRTELPAGSGPRHVVLTADGTRAYVVSEFAGTVTCLDVDAESGALSVGQAVELVPDADKAWAAELRLGPGQDVLYASERRTSRIFACRLEAGGGMCPIGAFPAPDCPTAYCLTASGDHLIALGEASGEAWVYRRERDGTLALASRTHAGAVPSWALAP